MPNWNDTLLVTDSGHAVSFLMFGPRMGEVEEEDGSLELAPLVGGGVNGAGGGGDPVDIRK